MRFTELRLAEPIVRAVAREGYTSPTPIQSKAIPEILNGQDVLGCAQTGTGKTAAFALPILHRLAESASSANRSGGKGRPKNAPSARTPRALVICPTRELATQIFDSFRAYGRFLSVRPTVVFGGVSQSPQVRSLRAGTDVLVATPGRLLDLMEQGFIDLRSIEALVLDEADRMLDMGFIRDIQRIVEHLPKKRQTLLFSATMARDIRRLADAILREPIFVEAAPAASTADSISQGVYMVNRRNKSTLLERLIRREGMERALVFTRTKHGADKLVKSLQRSGIEAGAIHSNKNQNARTRALAGFKSGRTPVLVATDIASRGIDVDEITHVVNFDMPNEPETYVHRIGRTARAGASGVAFSFCDHDEMSHLRSIERLIGGRIDVMDGEPDFDFESPAAHRQTRGRPTPKFNHHQNNTNNNNGGGGNGGNGAPRRKRGPRSSNGRGAPAGPGGPAGPPRGRNTKGRRSTRSRGG